MAKYLLELSLLDYSMIAYLPSKQAAAALCLSLQLLRDPLHQWVRRIATVPFLLNVYKILLPVPF